MRKDSVKACLSQAIVSAAQDELKTRLSDPNVNKKRIPAARAVERSLKSILRLRDGVMPDYNQWDPLMYATWYQASQINLAYSLLNWASDRSWPNNPLKESGGALQVVDFGCGTLAMQFAVGLAAADALRSGVVKDRIRVDSFDTSPYMMDMGARIWEHFSKLVVKMLPDDPLCEVLNSMELNLHQSVSSIEPIPRATRLVTAIHVVYDTNIFTVRQNLRLLARTFRPAGCFLTTFAGNGELLENLGPAASNSAYENWTDEWPYFLRPQFDGPVEEVYEWRQWLLERLNEGGLLMRADNVDYDLIKNMLNTQVEWRYRTPAIQAYIKKSPSRN